MNISKEFKVGLLVVIAGAVLYFGFNYLKGKDIFSGSQEYYAVYDDVNGLTQGNSVVVKGYTIGRVEDISLMPGKDPHLLVTLAINKDVKLTKGTVALLSNSDLLGGKTIVLKSGSSDEPLAKGDTLETKTDEALADILERNAIPVINNTNEILLEVREILDDRFKQNMKNIMANSDTVVRNAKHMSALINNTVALTNKNIASVSDEMLSLSHQIDSLLTAMHPIVNNMDAFSDSLSQLEMKKTMNEAHASLENLSAIMAKVDSGQGTLGKLVNDEELYTNINSTVKHMDYLVTDIELNPKRYINLSVFGKKPKDQRAIIKKSPSKTDGKDVKIRLKRMPASTLSVKLYSTFDKTIKEIGNEDIRRLSEEEIAFDLPEDLPSGNYMMKISWDVGSETTSITKK